MKYFKKNIDKQQGKRERKDKRKVTNGKDWDGKYILPVRNRMLFDRLFYIIIFN